MINMEFDNKQFKPKNEKSLGDFVMENDLDFHKYILRRYDL